jgi:hypothetical protein
MMGKILMGTYKILMGTYKFMMGTYKYMMGTYKMQVMHKFVLVNHLLVKEQQIDDAYIGWTIKLVGWGPIKNTFLIIAEI